MKRPKIVEFRDKITLCKFKSNVDAELNRSYDILPVKEVWAVVDVRSSNVELTTSGFRPETTYNITIRKQSVVCDCIKWKDRILKLTKPFFTVDNKYILLEAVETNGFPDDDPAEVS